MALGPPGYPLLPWASAWPATQAYVHLVTQMMGKFWPGDADHEALFYGYIIPEPPGCAYHPVDAPLAEWVETMGEWVLPYEAVRTASNPRTTLLGFMDQVQTAASELAGWDLALHRYVRPPRPALAAARALGIAATQSAGGRS